MTAVQADPDAEPVPDEPFAAPAGRIRLPQDGRTRYSLLALIAVALSVIGLIPGVPHWFSAVTMLVFVGTGPGCAVFGWLRPPPVSRFMVIPAYGLAAVIAITAAAAAAGWWSPHGIYAMLALGVVWSVIPNLGALVQDMVP